MNKWILGALAACMALSVSWAQGPAVKGAEVLVFDLARAIDECDEHTDIVEDVEKRAKKLQKDKVPEVQRLQVEKKRLMSQTLSQRDGAWYKAVDDALNKEAELKAIELLHKIRFSDDISRGIEKLIIAAKEQSGLIMKKRGANMVLISKLSPVRLETDADIKEELVSRRVLNNVKGVDITDQVIAAMNKRYKKLKKMLGNKRGE